ncbi:MAG TPA: hypothetical protein PKV13_02245 [Propionicimonas sp.]|nr:hypothetical protein [Propionicimonas sp.]
MYNVYATQTLYQQRSRLLDRENEQLRRIHARAEEPVGAQRAVAADGWLRLRAWLAAWNRHHRIHPIALPH